MASSEETFVLRNTVEFGFHSVHGRNITMSKDGLLAERIKSFDYGVVYGANILRGTTEFEVEITSCKTKTSCGETIWSGTLKLGVMQYKAGSKIKHSDIPHYALDNKMYCIWSYLFLFNKLAGSSGPCSHKKYGSANLENLREGDRLGLQVSHDGVLTFFVNGKSQGVAAQGVYQEGYDLYAVVDVYGRCKAVGITRAGTFTSRC